MKIVKVISHPLIVVFVFLLVIISGQHFGGFFVLYILLGLPQGAIHSVLGVVGIMILGLSYMKFRREKLLAERVLNLCGVVLMVLSLLLFFLKDVEKYNYGTFKQAAPLASLAIFSIVVLCFVLDNVANTQKNLEKDVFL